MIADSVYHTYCIGDGLDGGPNDPEFASRLATVRSAMTMLESTTVMRVGESTNCRNYTDIKWIVADLNPLPNSHRRGTYQCTDKSSGVCYAATITLDFEELDRSDHSNGYDDETVDRQKQRFMRSVTPLDLVTIRSDVNVL